MSDPKKATATEDRQVKHASPYYDEVSIARQVEIGRHREVIGGMWDELGRLQFEFLVAAGLKPQHRLLDIGCGSMRGGVHFARYLDIGNYYGIDLNEKLLDAGYEQEFKPEGLDKRVPRNHLRATNDFDLSPFSEKFDFALALSVFTHLPLNDIRICLERLAPKMVSGGRFFASVFEANPEEPTWTAHRHHRGNVTTYGDRDPYHYRRNDMQYLAKASGWTAEWVGEFDHPRDQQMVCFRITA